MARARGEGCAPAAAPLREHEHQGPGAAGHALRGRPGGTAHGGHHAGGDAEGHPCGPAVGGPLRRALAEARAAGIDLEAAAAELQAQGAKSFVQSWNDLLKDIRAKGGALAAR
ncbi:MAG: hypothetical protein ACKOTD_08945 [Phycisphaerales bacterium]